MIRFGFIIAVFFSATVAYAEKPADPPPKPVAEETTDGGEPDIVPVLKLKPAPFTGLLVPEGRFTELLDAELKLGAAEQKLAAHQRFTDNLEGMYKDKLKEATKPVPWYETPTFNRVLGFTIGVAVTGLCVWGGVQIVKATGNGT